jgi:hypothetical protein
MEVSHQLHALATLHLEKDPGTHWIEGWVGPRTGVDTVVKKKRRKTVHVKETGVAQSVQ